ncbi:MAG: PIN domain-containing protein [Microcoleaceae cyanobacterium]
MEEKLKKLCVVIDANKWRQDSNILLKTPLGVALLYCLKQKNGCIGLPEIIENEVMKHTIQVGCEAVEQINSNFKKIEIIMGKRSNYEVPDKTEIQKSIESRMKEIEPWVKRVPFTLEHAKSALQRVDEGTPPNKPEGRDKQQFKDSAIWEAILSLLKKNYEVHFITEDKGFFMNRN